VALREQVQNDITDAIHSPDALKKLAAIYGKLQDKVIDQGQQQIEAAQDKVDLWDRRLAVAENVEMAAGMGARVTVLDLDTRKLEGLDSEYRGRVVTLMSNLANLESCVADADLLAVPLPGDGPIGEAWVLSDRDDHQSRVTNGPLQGLTIGQVLAQYSNGTQQVVAQVAVAHRPTT